MNRYLSILSFFTVFTLTLFLSLHSNHSLVFADDLVEPVNAVESGQRAYSEDKRYIDHGNATITDTKTGLMWMKQDSYLHKEKWLNWFEAQEYTQALNTEGFANYIDWQIPKVEELQTLFEQDKINSKQVGREMVIHIDPIFSPNGSGAHWAIESNGRYNAFGVIFNTGKRFSANKKSRSRKSVRAVRYPPNLRKPKN